MQRNSVKFVGAALVAAGVWLGLASCAMAQPRMPHSPFAASPFGSAGPAGQAGAPPVARYVAGGASFTLDTSGPVPLMRYAAA